MKIFDAIMFNGEHDVLELRLNELDPIVDRFFICESLEPHGAAGGREHGKFDRHRVQDFKDKIEYVKVKQLRPEYTDATSGWARENYHRNALFQHLLKIAKPDDLVINTDCDEIPRAVAITAVAAQLEDTVFYFDMDLFYYNVTCYAGEWRRASIGKFKAFQRIGGFQPARGILDMPLPEGTQITVIKNGGWHFSYFNDIAGIRNKIQNFAHSSDVLSKALLKKSDAEIAKLARSRNDIFNPGKEFAQRAANDPRLPAHFLYNQKRFEGFCGK